MVRACVRFSMDSSKLQECLDRADAQIARGRNATARLATYIEALARDGYDATTTRKLLKAFEEMEALLKIGRVRRAGGMVG